MIERNSKGQYVKSGVPRRDWHRDRFIYRDGYIEKKCTECGVSFYLPPSKVNNQERCGSECNKKYREKQKENRARICEGCGQKFYARLAQIAVGHGRYCSHKCQGIANEGDKSQFYTGGKTKAHARCTKKRNAQMRNGTGVTKKQIYELGTKQSWKCAICKTDIRKRFHRDHIYPLAKGGKHEIDNIQLLCKPCNVRKKDADPIEYMQKLGFLL